MSEKEKKEKTIEFIPGVGWGSIKRKPTTKRLYYNHWNENKLNYPETTVTAIDCDHQPFCDDFEQHKVR